MWRSLLTPIYCNVNFNFNLMLILAVFIVLNVLFKVFILLTLDFNYISFTCLMLATVSALLCLAVRFYCSFIHVYFLLVL